MDDSNNSGEEKTRGLDFIRQIIKEDLDSGRILQVITRFPPEPNGYLHIGHAKAFTLSFSAAEEFGGICRLRYDDTNPEKEDEEYVRAIEDDIRWMGFKWEGESRHASSYFAQFYEWAVELVKAGKAYVDHQSPEEMVENRGTPTKSGIDSPYRNRSVEENLELLEQMRTGELDEGSCVLRAKIAMDHVNILMRDPAMYRIRKETHHRTGDDWCIYPMYDFAHGFEDAIEGVTHSLCSLEFVNHRPLYDWFLDNVSVPSRPHQYEFARLNMTYTVMSKRKLLELVEGGYVNGWDDPRMPTIAGYRRRGYTPESILSFCEQIGIAKANSVVDVSQLEFCIRDDLNLKVPRVMCVLDPLKVTITNYEGDEEIEASYYPHDVPREGSRKLPFSREIYIDREDFSENPPKGYFRLTPDQPVRLKYAYIITCQEVIKDAEGNITEIKATYHPDSKSGQDKSGIKVKSAIQWVEAKSAKKAEVRIYDRLFNVENPKGIEDLNPDSLKVIEGALIEPAVIEEKPDVRFQFEREGYFYADPVDYTDKKPVFNKIVSLKDSWAKKKKAVKKSQEPQQKASPKTPQKEGKEAPLTKEEQERFDRYTKVLKLNESVANILTRDKALSDFFKEVLTFHDNAVSVANIVANEIARELKNQSPAELKFTHKDIAELVKMTDDAVISTKIAKEVFEHMSKSGENPVKIVEEKGLKQISNPDEILPVIDEVIAKNPENVQKYRDGNKKLFGFFVGQVLKATGGKANPEVVNRLIRERLG